MTKAVREFAGFDALWAHFAPDTPWGRDQKAAMPIHTDPAHLESLYDQTTQVLAWMERLAGDPVRLSMITHHLKRMPRIPETVQKRYDEVELFQVKKFTHNARALAGLLPEAMLTSFGFTQVPAALEASLSVGRQTPESFYLTDAYSPELTEIRQAIRSCDAARKAIERRRLEEIQDTFHLSFEGRSFLLVPREHFRDVDTAMRLLVMDPHDDHLVCVRPMPSGEALSLAEQRTALGMRERACEDDILATLSQGVQEVLPSLLNLRDAVCAFDLAFARARMAKAFGLTRPHLTQEGILIRGGRHLPCEARCKDLQVGYEPLHAAFQPGVTMLFGSNMGGKTVVLKTVAALQLAAQAGLFVPAERFDTQVFPHLLLLGGQAGDEALEGLSGFGSEIHQFTEAWSALQGGALLLMDEFARSTRSQEAEALLSAVVEALQSRPGVITVCATHFQGVRRLPGVSYFRMHGLNHQALNPNLQLPTHRHERLRVVTSHMRYCLEPDDQGRLGSDAILVARMLGLDDAISDRAHAFYMEATS